MEYRIVLAQSITKVVTTGFRYGAFAFIAWMGFRSVQAVAGQITLAEISVGVKFLMSEEKSKIFSWAVGVAGAVYGWKQRTFRKDDVERRSQRIADLERKLDSRRSSSRLSKRGDTNPEDME